MSCHSEGMRGRIWTRRTLAAGGLAAALALPAAGVELDAGRPYLVSRSHASLRSDTPGAASFGTSGGNQWSSDGRYVTFASNALNLVPGQVDHNTNSDIFLIDLVTGVVTLVSHATGSPTATANAYSVLPEISADGRYVVYRSFATDLVAGQVDTNNWTDIFLWDRITDTTTLVSHAAGSPSVAASHGSDDFDFSADGRFVAFASSASNLVAGITNLSGHDAFLYDRTTDTSVLVSRSSSSATTSANNSTTAVSLSDDGNYVVLQSRATNLVTGQSDLNNADDVFVWTRATGAMALVSRTAASATTTSSAGAEEWRIAADGSQILFRSSSNNLITSQSDTNNGSDFFLYNRTTGARVLVSRASTGTATAANNVSSRAELSANGNFVVFHTAATNIVTGQSDTNARDDAFLYNRTTGTNVLVSHTSSSLTTTVNNSSAFSWVSPDGSYVLLASSAVNLIAGLVKNTAEIEAYLYTRATGALQLLSHVPGSLVTTGNGGGNIVAMSPDLSQILLLSGSADLVTGVTDLNGAADLFLYHRATDSLELLTLRDPDEASLSAGGVSTLPASMTSPLSADGRFFVYVSNAADMVPGQVETNHASEDVFLFDRETGTTLRVSPTANVTSNGIHAQSPAISADGSVIVFTSNAGNLIPGVTDTNSSHDVFLYDRTAATLSLVSHNSTSPTTAAANPSAQAPLASENGRYVVYAANAANLVSGQSDTNSAADVFLYDRVTDTTVLVSHAASGATTSANAASQNPAMSADGRYIAFASVATNLVAGQTDTAGTWDIFLYDRDTAAVTLVSRTTAGAATASGAPLQIPALSSDGRFVAYASAANSVVAGQTDTNSAADVFLFDRTTGTTSLVSHTPASATTAAGAASQGPVLSADGAWILYVSSATNLVTGQVDTNNATDVFLYNRTLDVTQLVSARDGAPTTTGSAASLAPQINADGQLITFLSAANNLVAGQLEAQGVRNGLGNGYFNDIFVVHRPSGRKKLVTHNDLSALTTGVAGNTPTERAFPSADGRWIAFASASQDLAAFYENDLNDRQDVFLYTPFADLAVTKTDGVASLVPGEGVTYTITVTNSGPGRLLLGDVMDDFPSLSGVTWTCTATGSATCTPAGAGSLLDVVTLPAGESLTYTATGTVLPEATGTLVNTASAEVPLAALDPTLSDAEATDSDTLTPVADLGIAITDSPDPILTGSPLTYTIDVTNAGPSNAASLSVIQALPTGAVFVSASGTGWSCAEASGVVTCTRSQLAPGSAPAITVEVTAPAVTGTAVSNVSISSGTTDPSSVNDTDGAETTVQ